MVIVSLRWAAQRIPATLRYRNKTLATVRHMRPWTSPRFFGRPRPGKVLP